MKKRYQIDRERAVQNFQKQAQHSEESLQLALPLKQVAAALQDGVGHLMRQAGLELMQLIMAEEVRQTGRRALPTPQTRPALPLGRREGVSHRRRAENADHPPAAAQRRGP